MKRWTVQTLVAPLLFGAVLFGGCSQRPSSGTAIDDGALSLEAPYGGYTATNESPQFGEMLSPSAFEESEPAFDGLVESDEWDRLSSAAGATVYLVAVRWGMLDGDSTVTMATDWSGSAAVSHGVIGVRRLIRFERAQDHLLGPRTSRQLVEWASQTTVHYDGLLLTIVDPPATNADVADDEGTLSISAGEYSQTFLFSELAELDLLVDVDNLGNQVSIESRSGAVHRCGGGPTSGVWAFDDDHVSGHFLGAWMSADGAVAGHVRGHFGVHGDAQLFYGKIIGLDGEFRGYLRGHWWRGDTDRPHGGFEGEWIAADGHPFGIIRGRWHAGRNSDDADSDNDRQMHGFFAGWWVKFCPEDPPDKPDSP